MSRGAGADTVIDLTEISRLAPDPARAVSAEALRGDASDRRYYRIRFDPPLDAGPTAVLMVMGEGGGHGPDRELPFIDVQRHLSRWRIPVPRIYGHDEGRSLLLLEDAGDVTLEDRLREADAAAAEALYRKAIDILVRIQARASRGDETTCIAFTLAFDVEKLMWELRFFLEHAVEGLWERALPRIDRERIETGFQAICADLAAEPRVFAHRDYHSRNLMVRQRGHHEEGLVVLDFQDARMGPATYDLASLLRDSYHLLDEGLFDRLVAYYLDRAEAAGLDPGDPEAFRRRFDLMAIQRNLKAVGTFAYQKVVRGNDRYLPCIPPTLDYVRENLQRHPRHRELHRLLARYVEGLD